MFLKTSIKQKAGLDYTHYRLCESYREGRQIRNRTLLSLGDLESELESSKHKLFVTRLHQIHYEGKMHTISAFYDERVESLALHYSQELKTLEKAERKAKQAQGIEEVYINTLKNSNIRELGTEWMCYQSCEQLHLKDYLLQQGWSEKDTSLALTQIVSRAIYPVSELKTVSYIKENSAISELTGLDISRLTKDNLYKMSHRLYKEKEGLEKFLSKRTNELFSLEDKIILYDLTNTYYEGRMEDSRLARFGRSKEKRSDAKLIVLAVVVNQEGFLKDSQIFEGNIADCNTLKEIVTRLKSNRPPDSKKKQIVVIDAGISTEENLAMLQQEGFDYLCVSRKRLKEYVAIDENPVVIDTKSKKTISIREICLEDNPDTFFQVKSQSKGLKESAMENRFTQAYEQRLNEINEALGRKGGTKRIEKVWERIGRLKEKYSSVNRLYEISLEDNGKGIATRVNWKRKQTAETTQHGTYFLRTSLPSGQDEELIWLIYNTIREIESTFRCLKTDLNLRPVYHKTDDASMAHLHLGLLAYWLVSTIRYQLKQKGENSDWREIVRVMSTQKMVTTSVVNTDNELIEIRKCSEPEKRVQDIYQLLGYNARPFIQKRRKSVVPQKIPDENQMKQKQEVMDG